MMRQEVLLEQFFTALISGDRPACRAVVDQLLDADWPAEKITAELFWPTLEHIQNLHRHDQMTDMAHHFATRLMRGLVDQMQLRLTQHDQRGKIALVICGPEESEEIGAQMMGDLLEADGYAVHYAGGGVANDELVAQLGEMRANLLVVFGVTPSTVPFTRLLIDRLHEIGACPQLQIAVGGGVFNRADGLAEEIGADVWANTPHDLVRAIDQNPQKRMTADQRTVGRKRKGDKRSAA